VHIDDCGAQPAISVPFQTTRPQNGTARLEEAVAAYHAALAELTRDRVPLEWATSTGNQGVALMLIAERLGHASETSSGSSPRCIAAARASAARSVSSSRVASRKWSVHDSIAQSSIHRLLYQVDDKVRIITLNRPEKLNAISRELQLALTEAFARADADPATSVVLLRAEGRSFCAGYDIGAQPGGTDDWRSNPAKAHAHLAPQLEFEMAPWLMKKPVVAAVQGHVLGGGV
jgi:hypothetical protein